MATKNIIKADVNSLVGDLSTICDHLRILQEVLMDQLCEHSPGDAKSSMKFNERMYVLLDGIPQKLKQMESLHRQIIDINFNGRLLAVA